VIVALAYAAGSWALTTGRVPLGEGRLPELPEGIEELEGWLAEREAAAGVRPGLEKAVVWADSTRSRTNVALVYLPGLGASRAETAPLADSVAADLGANLFYMRPTGHALAEDPLGDVRARDWFDDAREALAIGSMLGERVVVIGSSNGGALAVWAAIRHPDALDALVLLAPNFGPADPMAIFAAFPGGRLLARLIVGETYVWQPENRAQAAAWDTAYASSALVPMMRLSNWVDQPRRLREVRTPALVLYSTGDLVVSPAQIDRAVDALGSEPKRLEAIPDVESRSRHNLAGDAVSPGTTEDVRQRIRRFLVEDLGMERPAAIDPSG
jgi:pimeloyl-ACP methyl ester carboxylesterase